MDVIEPIAKFTAGLRETAGVRNIYNVGLEEWQPSLEPSSSVPAESSTCGGERAEPRYDVIWNQWCLNYLNDEQLVAYLRTCGSVLNPEAGGKAVIVLKENVSLDNEDVFDDEDSSVTR